MLAALVEEEPVQARPSLACVHEPTPPVEGCDSGQLRAVMQQLSRPVCPEMAGGELVQKIAAGGRHVEHIDGTTGCEGALGELSGVGSNYLIGSVNT